MKTLSKKNSIFAFTLVLVLLFSDFGCLNALSVNANAAMSEINLLQTALSHLAERVDALEETVANLDTETVNTKIAELEEAIIAAEASAKAYADTQDEALKNELSAAIESAKTELADAIKTKADTEAVNAKIAELEDAIVDAEVVSKAYTDTQNATLKNELSAAIERAKAELADAIKAKADAEAVNAKIAELEDSIVAADAVSKAYADTQDEALKNELSAAIESVKTKLTDAIKEKADTETVNAKIAELEDSIIAAEAVAKAYANTQNAALKNELIAAIESAKAELAGIDNTNTNVGAINARITELDTAVTAITKELNYIKQKTEELENKNDELQTILIIVCVISGITFCGCVTFVIWFFIDKKKRI